MQVTQLLPAAVYVRINWLRISNLTSTGFITMQSLVERQLGQKVNGRNGIDFNRR